MSIPLFFCIVVLFLLMVNYAFYRLGMTYKHKFKEPPSDFIPTNILGLLALILGFSFSLTIDHYEKRRILSVEEANSISTAYLRSKTIKFKSPEENRNLFKKYIDMRILGYTSVHPEIELAKLDDIEAEIWKKLIEVTKKERGEIENSYMVSLNTLFDTANMRTKAMLKMLPITFYVLILILASAAVGFMNFDRGISGGGQHWRSVLFIFLFAILLTFIFDMDHFRRGIIRIHQNPLIEVQTLIYKD
jgi:hypothetical protein